MSCFTVPQSVFCPQYTGMKFRELGFSEINEFPVALSKSDFDHSIETALKIHYDYLNSCGGKSLNNNIPLYATWLCATAANNARSCGNGQIKPLCPDTCFKFAQQFAHYTSECASQPNIANIRKNIIIYCESLLVSQANARSEICISQNNTKKSCGLSSFKDICKKCNKNACNIHHTKNIYQYHVEMVDEEEDKSKYERLKNGLIISAIIIGGLIGLLLIICIAVILFKKMNRKRQIWKKAAEEKNRFDEIQVSPTTRTFSTGG
eukprot:NODE_173_length_14219_cov_0.603824.p7 type:complete len:264 gc:universal NODE_173_length_14219_cov_0.603824:6330-5539(-)